jgi:hypothetical protein
VRAALWVGLYYYWAGEEETALEYFERARKHARTGELRQRADFWCDQARMRTGKEPLVEGRRDRLWRAQVLTRRPIRARGSAGGGGSALIEGRAGGWCRPSPRGGDILMPGPQGQSRVWAARLACSGLPEDSMSGRPGQPLGMESGRSAGFPGGAESPAGGDLQPWVDSNRLVSELGGRVSTRLGESPSRAAAKRGPTRHSQGS